jgi:predicted MPP superfamily phosphohydrolase
VTGNHEYYWDAPGLVQKVRELGFTALINENRIVQVGSAKILIAGITDPMGQMLSGHAPDINKATRSSESTEFKIFLSHRPDAYLQSEPRGFDLQFSGHTHSGQYFPFNLLIGFFHKYSRGLYRHGHLWVYVNPGTGYWGPANRFGVPAEITLLTLAPR